MLKVAAKVVFNNLPKISAEMAVGAQAVVVKTCEEILRISTESMQGPKTGRIYRRGKKEHQASAPGEAPAIDYGVLVNSIQLDFPRPGVGVVYTNTEYAPVLEFGGIRMEARPFFKPAAEKVFPAFLEAMKKVVGR